MTVRVVVADDQTVVREGLALLLGLMADIEVVGTATDGVEAVERVLELQPDVALLDLRMPHLDGVAAAQRLAEATPSVAVVVLTTYADDESVLAALRAGARGYLTKDASSEEIERAVRDAAAGRMWLDPAVQKRLVELVTVVPSSMATPTAVGLTDRETQVLLLMADGLSNRDIAARLVVTEATIKTHVGNVFAKLNVADRASAVAWAFRSGLASR